MCVSEWWVMNADVFRVGDCKECPTEIMLVVSGIHSSGGWFWEEDIIKNKRYPCHNVTDVKFQGSDIRKSSLR